VALQDSNAAAGAKMPGQITVLLNFYDELLRKIPPKWSREHFIFVCQSRQLLEGFRAVEC